MENISVGIKTFKRPDCIKQCLESIPSITFKEVLVADDNSDEEYEKHHFEIYEEEKQRLNLKVIRLPFDSGLSKGRNEVFKQANTEYVLWLDDDILCPNNILSLVYLFEKYPYVGAVSGLIRQGGVVQGNATDFKLGKGRPKRVTPRFQIQEQRVCFAEQMSNCAIFRKKMVDELPWDNFYKIGGEHSDFSLNHKVYGHYKMMCTTWVIFEHVPQESREYIKSWRCSQQRLKDSEQHFIEKWGFPYPEINHGWVEPFYLKIYRELSRCLGRGWYRRLRRIKTLLRG